MSNVEGMYSTFFSSYPGPEGPALVPPWKEAFVLLHLSALYNELKWAKVPKARPGRDTFMYINIAYVSLQT